MAMHMHTNKRKQINKHRHMLKFLHIYIFMYYMYSHINAHTLSNTCTVKGQTLVPSLHTCKEISTNVYLYRYVCFINNRCCVEQMVKITGLHQFLFT